jgi:diguanylate cyclase (GGDEF)-like protein
VFPPGTPDSSLPQACVARSSTAVEGSLDGSWKGFTTFAGGRAEDVIYKSWRWKPRLLIVSAFTMFWASLAGIAACGQARAGSSACPSPVLTTTREVHSLSYGQASRACRVDLRGVVVYFDPYREGGDSTFIWDKTGNVIFVYGPSGAKLALHPGSYVEVTGETDPGGFSPSVNADTVRILGSDKPLPVAHRATLSSLLMDNDDGKWVELEGVVHAVGSDEMRVVLTLGTDEGPITASTVKENGVDYAGLIGAKILLRGRPSPLVDRNYRRMVGVRILFPNLSVITVEKPAPRDPYALPIQSIGSLMQFSPDRPFEDRVHVQGIVTLDWPGREVCIQDGKAALCVQTSDQRALKEGQPVDVVGFSAWDDYLFTLTDAMLRPVDGGSAPSPIRISAEEALSGKHNGGLVQIEGRLIGKSRGISDSTLLLSAGKMVFPAVLPDVPAGNGGELAAPWPDGSKILVTGVLSGKVDEGQIARGLGVSQIESFRILLRSAKDVAVLESPPWWTTRRLLMLVSVLAMLAMGVLLWNAALRFRVERQTRHIRRSEAKFRHMAQHDALTGLVVRNVLIDRLEGTIKGARQTQFTFALLMMDVDRFKQVNDTLGHAVGDEMLRAAASRIRDSVRRSDTVARMGGDEFMVLLLGVCGLDEAQAIAAQVTQNMSAPVFVDGREVPLSASVGLTTFPEGGTDAVSLMRSADLAMYRAKAQGGNCYKVFFPGDAQANASQRTSADAAAGSTLRNSALARS